MQPAMRDMKLRSRDHPVRLRLLRTFFLHWRNLREQQGGASSWLTEGSLVSVTRIRT